VKKVACYPEKVARQDYRCIEKYDHFSFSDMVHYILILKEARRLGEIHYLINAIMEFRTKSDNNEDEDD
jgi:hypothetical protein